MKRNRTRIGPGRGQPRRGEAARDADRALIDARLEYEDEGMASARSLPWCVRVPQTAQPDGSPSWTPSEWRFSVCERANRWIGPCNTATGDAFA